MDVVQNEWQDKELECFKDPVNMLFGWCCALCMVCDNAKRMDESVGLYCCLGYCCPICAIYSLRSKTREKFGIEVCLKGAINLSQRFNPFCRQGDTMKDVLCSCCCGACVNCQVNKELKKRSPENPGLFPI